MTADEADELRLGVPYGTVRLAPTDPAWSDVAARLGEEVRRVLGADALAVEHIGSTAVPGLLAKPIVDIAIRMKPAARRDHVIACLESLGYEYRGDAGGSGGLVFVLDVRPWYRVAHLHVVADGDPQWERYLTVVDRLRRDAELRVAYESVKRDLATAHPGDRRSYTQGKHEVVARILRGD
jgi:GrpB-like predicted nucleotidyltransferase (UPF0157 family)